LEFVFDTFHKMRRLRFSLINMRQKILSTDSSRTTILIRLMVGAVFLSEGIQKFLYPAIRGAGRFFEIACGLAILIGILTRLSAIPTLIIMLVAIATTKSTVFLEEGFWVMMHGSRTDWAMLLGSIYLILRGGGKWSVDGKMV
jgi:putative oxidoreductase